MTKTHAMGAGMSYGMRYLLKMIFNVAVGEDDTDGNEPTDDSAITDPIFDKIELAEATGELQKVKPDIEAAKITAGSKRNLIAAYNAKLKKLKAS